MGVIFEEDMSWNKQVNEIRKISPLLNEDCKKLLLNALVLPHINCSSWNTCQLQAQRNLKAPPKIEFQSLKGSGIVSIPCLLALVGERNRAFRTVRFLVCRSCADPEVRQYVYYIVISYDL